MPHDVVVPGDKSISHRALIFAALAAGESRVRDILQSDDIRSTAKVLRSLGVPIPDLSADFMLESEGVRALRQPAEALDCGNSGTTARLMCGVAAALPFSTRFIGDASLSRRPMRRLTRVLEQMGASFEFESGGDGLPMRVRGARLHNLEFVNESGSAQIKSALLLAGLVAGATVAVREPRKSRDHTEIMMRALGVSIRSDSSGAEVRPGGAIRPLDIRVPGDPSSAAFFAARAALVEESSVRLRRICLNPTRLGFLRVLERMGAEVRQQPAESLEAGESVGDVTVGVPARADALRGISIGRDEIPSLVDELPLVACVAACAHGETRVEGAEELRYKESDRIAAIVGNLRRLGAGVEELPDGFIVRGPSPRLAGRVETHADHRIAMAFGVLASVSENKIEIDDPGCVSISYPGFWTQLARIAS
jgi:3-phosphoshikimate 1-carboxyvinyltransferase